MNTNADALPERWGIASGNDVFQFVRGVSYSKTEVSDSATKNSVAILRAGNIQDGCILFDDLVHVPNERVRDEQRIRKGDLIIAMSSGSASLVGKVAVATSDMPGVSFGAFCGLLRPRAREYQHWLSKFFQTRDYRNLISEAAAGVNINNLRSEYLYELSIPIPPTRELMRLEPKIEGLQERSRKAREALAEVGPLLEQFRQSLLAAAFRGDLTADWRAANPNVEPSSELLNRIRQERRQKWEQWELAKYEAKGKQPPKGWQNNYQEPAPLTVSEFPNLPKGWCWCRLGMLGTDPTSTVQTGPFGAQLHTEEFVEHGVPVIAVGNLTGVGFTKQNLYYITHEKAQQLSRYDVQAGDLLFARSGATLGKVCVAPDFVTDWRMTGHILRARLDVNFVLPTVAVYALWGDSTVKKIVNEGIRGMTRPGYNTSLLNAIPIPLPPLSEQRRILNLVEEAFEGTERLSTHKADTESDLFKLDQSILAKAFRGELVPQDPNDEPASVLLERIRCARAEAQSNGKPRASKPGAKRGSIR